MSDNASLIKLRTLLNSNKDKIKSYSEFEELFEELLRLVRSAVKTVNEELANVTNDRLKLFISNPYTDNSNSYFFMVQFFINRKDESFNLDNTENFPILQCFGDPPNGKISIYSRYINLQNSESDNGKSQGVAVGLITKFDNERILEILVNFVSVVYNLEDGKK